MQITFDQNNTPRTITALSQTAAGSIVISFLASGAIDASTQFTITAGAPNGVGQQAAVNPATALIVSKAEMLLQVVKPPESYIDGLVSEVEGSGMVIDLDGYTTYRNTIQQGIKSQTVTIPTTQSRATAVFSVPRSGNQNPTLDKDNGGDFRFDGIYNELQFYRTQIDTEYYPNAPIDLSQMSTTLNGGWHFSQEHLRELEKALASAGLVMMSSEQLHQNFVIGRALSHKGSSMDLTATPINLYLDYAGNGGAVTTKDVISYVAHKIRVMITPMGVEVMS